jgi:hypothetical protein
VCFLLWKWEVIFGVDTWAFSCFECDIYKVRRVRLLGQYHRLIAVDFTNYILCEGLNFDYGSVKNPMFCTQWYSHQIPDSIVMWCAFAEYHKGGCVCDCICCRICDVISFHFFSFDLIRRMCDILGILILVVRVELIQYDTISHTSTIWRRFFYYWRTLFLHFL